MTMGGLLTRKRLIAAVAALAVAVLLVAGTAWTVRAGGGTGDAVDSGESDPAVPGAVEPVAAKDIHGVSIAMDVPTYDLGIEGHGGTMEVIVDNGSGGPLREVALDVVIDEPGGGLPPMMVAGSPPSCEYEPEYDDPDSEHPDDEYVDEECVRQQREGKQGCPVSVTGEGDIPYARHARCVQTLKEGENRFGFDIRILEDNATAVRDYPTVTAAARLSVGDEEFATAEKQVKTKYPKEWDRLTFDDFPKDVSTDRTESNPYHWSVTITNDTGEPIDDAVGVWNVEYTVGVGSGHPGCRRDEDKPSDYFMVCEGIDIPVGGSVTIPMTAYFNSKVGKLKSESECEQEGDECTKTAFHFSISEEDEKTFASGEAITTVRLGG